MPPRPEPRRRSAGRAGAPRAEHRDGGVPALRTAGSGWVARKGREPERVVGNVVTDGVCVVIEEPLRRKPDLDVGFLNLAFSWVCCCGEYLVRLEPCVSPKGAAGTKGQAL